MRSWRILAVWALLALAVAASAGRAAADSYSYGGGVQDPVADAYEAFAAALGGPTPDWRGAERQVAAVAPELRLVFGDCVLRPLEEAVARRDPAAARGAFRTLLVLQVARRLAQARDAMERDYPAAKASLARARRAYEALAPELKAADAAAAARVEAGLEAMAGALGNPGLFGVGRRPPDPPSFDRYRQEVLALLAGRFGPPGVDPLRLHVDPCPGEGGPGAGGSTGGRPWAWAAGLASVGAAVGAAAWALRYRRRRASP